MDTTGWPATHLTASPDGCFGQLQPEPQHLATDGTTTTEAATPSPLASSQPQATQMPPAPSPQLHTSMAQWRWKWVSQHIEEGTLTPPPPQADQVGDTDTDPDGTVLSREHTQWLLDRNATTQQYPAIQPQPAPPSQTPRWADFEESDEEYSTFEHVHAATASPIPATASPVHATVTPVQATAPPVPATGGTSATPQNLIDIFRWAASQQSAPTPQPAPSPDWAALSEGFSFPNQPPTPVHPPNTPETFCGMHLHTAHTHVPATPAHIQSTEQFLDQYYEQHQLHVDTDQYDAFNDHQLDYPQH